AHRAGRASVTVAVARHRGGRREAFVLPVGPLAAPAWWGLAVGSWFSGLLWGAAELLALWLSPGSRLARTTAKLGLASGLFLLTIFDFHTTRALVPWFFVSFGLLTVQPLNLALRLPDDARPFTSFPRLELMLDLFGLAVGCSMAALHLAGHSVVAIQSKVSIAFGASLVALAGTFLARLHTARGWRRDTMKALAWAVVPLSLLAGSFHFLTRMSMRSPADVGVYPLLGLVPLAILYAVVRFDLWQSRTLLSRILTRFGVGLLLALFSVGVGTAGAVFGGAELRSALAGALVAGFLSALSVAVAFRLSDRVIFPSRAAYRPTVARLSGDLTAAKTPDEVARALEQTVLRWLPCDRVDVELGAAELSSMMSFHRTHEGWWLDPGARLRRRGAGMDASRPQAGRRAVHQR
ncbi:MAG: hypothetical protein AAGA56_30835, partial [Myxococcota bacterium]